MKDLDRRISKLARHAYHHAPAIRGLMDEAGVDPADIQGADDLARIPVLSKDALVEIHRQNPPFGGFLTIDRGRLCRGYISRRARFMIRSRRRPTRTRSWRPSATSASAAATACSTPSCII